MSKNTKQVVSLAKQILLKGFSCFLAFLGTVLMFLGAVEYAKIPEVYYAGGAIMGFAILFYIGEIIIQIIKVKQKGK